MKLDPWVFEKEAAVAGYVRIAGLDEAGRGPLAGPVVAAAVILSRTFPVDGVTDSKKLTPRNRERLFDHIYDHASSIGIGIVDAVEIDRINIHHASLLAMAISVENLKPAGDFLLVDGKFPIPSSLPQKAMPKGDALSVSIAAASIVAKVSRDRIMKRYHEDYPQFGFDRNKGYPTREHRKAIAMHGFCPIHRRSYKGVKGQMIQRVLPFDTGHGA
jgi:ribonuclease HII